MTVPAQELRPRGAVAILDAAIRLCARESGVWLLTLPGAAVLTAAAFYLVDTRAHGRSVVLPALGLTLAWMLRGVGQAAAAYHVETRVLGTEEAKPWSAYRAAWRRLPSIIVTVTVLALFHLCFLTGVGLLLPFFINPEVAYAAVMTGKRHPLAILGTSQALLGPTRSVAVAVRFLFLVQGLVLLNLHIAANAVLWVLTELAGLDLTFAWSFVSLKNASWDVALLAVGFTLLEPLRAAAGGLLRVDARVRQEGLGLIARVEQLPSRHLKRQAVSGVAVLVLTLGMLGARAAHAGTPGPKTLETASQRLRALAIFCALDRPGLGATLDRARSLPPADVATFERFEREAEREVTRSGACETFAPRLKRVVAELEVLERVPEKPTLDPKQARRQALRILARDEFYEAAPKEALRPAPADTEPGWFQRFLRWLEKLFHPRDLPETAPLDIPAAGGLVAAKALAYFAAAAGVALILFFILRALGDRTAPAPETDPSIVALGDAELGLLENALSRPADAWARHADALAQSGAFLLALRSLYLAVLAQLHREGAIDYRVTQSNWDHVLRFRGRETEQGTFRDLTVRFDFSVYGRNPTGAPEYQRFRELTAPILRRSLDAEGAAPT